MNIEVLLTEAEIADEFVEALEARDIPEKFFYWTPLSVRTWNEFSGDAHESLRDTWVALAARAKDLVRNFGGRVPVISFGAGGGSKERMVLKALADAGLKTKYYPVDSSQTMLEMACAAAEDDDHEALGIKADISSPVHLLLAADVSEAPRLFIMAGNTLGGFDPLDHMRQLAECMHEGDLLIVDARIREENPPEPTEAQKRFILAPLAGAGVSLEDGELRINENRDDRRDGFFLMTRRFHTSRELTMVAGGRQIHIERGERIFLNFRYRFTRAAFRWLITDQAGLKVLAEIPTADGRFVTMVCSK
jgi:hypothetical protein